jgi:hypothetical protein
MFFIPEFDPLYAVPPRPPQACSHWSPMRFGMSSDWGAAADWKDPQSWIKSKMHTVCRVGSTRLLVTLTTNQGTLPFISNAVLQGCAHEAFSDLESFFWLAYLITCNCDGPFNKRRDWTLATDGVGIRSLVRPYPDSTGFLQDEVDCTQLVLMMRETKRAQCQQ